MQPIGFRNMLTLTSGDGTISWKCPTCNKWVQEHIGKECSGCAKARLMWYEVPQAVYLSWSKERQLDYNLRRDLNTAVHPELCEVLGAEWYLNRAADSREELNTLLSTKKAPKVEPSL